MSQECIVTIGMPVFNGEKTLADVLQAVLAQTYTNFRIIISDDASSDGSEAICRAMAHKDNRIEYVRQKTNIGLYANFRYVLEKANTKYFAWVSQDDIRSNNFLAENLGFLDGNFEYVGSTSPNRFIAQHEKRLIDFDLDGSFNSRAMNFLGNILDSHAILYSVFRTDLLKGCPYLKESYLALDWSICMYMISLGPIKRTSGSLIEIGAKGVSNSRNRWNKFRGNKIEYFLPFYRFSVSMTFFFHKMNLKTKVYTICYLIKLNLWAFKHQVIESIIDYRNEYLLRQ